MLFPRVETNFTLNLTLITMINDIENYRKLNKLSRKVLCKEAGVSTVTYSKILRGADPKLSTIIKLIRVLGLELRIVI